MMRTMRKISGWFWLGILAASGIHGQTPDVLKFDTAQARVIVTTWQPHQRNPPREYALNRVLVFLGGGQMRMGIATKAEKFDFKAGDAKWSAAGGPYITENPTDHSFQVVEIELKNTIPNPVPITKLDPVRVDSQHYEVMFENDQVRVLRVHYGPREKGALHEHILNRVVCYLSEQPNIKPGDVRISGAMTHTEENETDHPVERIAVELK